MTREEAIYRLKNAAWLGTDDDFDYVLEAVNMAVEALSATREWIPVTDRLPSKEDCPMDCMVTRYSKYVGNYTDMAVAEADGTWTHEDWDAIVVGDVESGRKTGLISTRDDKIVAWMELPEPYRKEKR